MKISIFLFFLMITQASTAQHWGKTRYHLDSLQEYSREQQEYEFILEGMSQGLFFDSLSLIDRKELTINITNNSLSSIYIQDYRMKDGAVLWNLNHPRQDSILPNQTFSFTPFWTQRQGPFNANINFQYTSNGEEKTFILRIWGWNELRKKSVEHISLKGETKDSMDTIGSLIKTSKDSDRIIEEYEYRYPNDSVTERDYFQNKRLTWTEVGSFKNGKLWNGIRKSNSSHERNRTLLFEDGKQNGIIFRNEIVNRVDSDGKQGKWIEFYDSDSIKSIANYQNDHTDSVIYYFPSGTVSDIYYYNNKRYAQRSYQFYESGELRSKKIFNESDTILTTYFRSGNVESIRFRNNKRTNYYTDEHSQKCPYKSVYTTDDIQSNLQLDYYSNKRFDASLDYGQTTDYYKNCTIYRRDNPKEIYVEGIEGREMLNIKYTVEKGNFKDNKLYSGVREYWTEKGKLLKTIKVVNGNEH